MQYDQSSIMLLFEHDYRHNHNYNKIVKSDWLSTALISALIGEYAPSRALLNDFFCFTASKKNFGISCPLIKKEPHISQILLKLWLIGNRTLCRPIRSVIILVIKQIGLPHFVNHSYAYRPNWTPLSPVTIANSKGNELLLNFGHKFQPLYYYMRNFCNFIGLEQWYFSLIWNTLHVKITNLLRAVV